MVCWLFYIRKLRPFSHSHFKNMQLDLIYDHLWSSSVTHQFQKYHLLSIFQNCKLIFLQFRYAFHIEIDFDNLWRRCTSSMILVYFNLKFVRMIWLMAFNLKCNKIFATHILNLPPTDKYMLASLNNIHCKALYYYYDFPFHIFIYILFLYFKVIVIYMYLDRIA